MRNGMDRLRLGGIIHTGMGKGGKRAIFDSERYVRLNWLAKKKISVFSWCIAKGVWGISYRVWFQLVFTGICSLSAKTKAYRNLYLYLFEEHIVFSKESLHAIFPSTCRPRRPKDSSAFSTRWIRFRGTSLADMIRIGLLSCLWVVAAFCVFVFFFLRTFLVCVFWFVFSINFLISLFPCLIIPSVVVVFRLRGC